MANLWQFFGLPDPEAPTTTPKRKPKKKVSEGLSGQQMTLIEAEDIEEKYVAPPVEKQKKVESKNLPPDWQGPITPDGEAFHDVSNLSSKPSELPDRALRYVSPDQMHRLPLQQIGERMIRGDTIVVDLRSLIHMDTQANACRRQLKALGDNIGVHVFALDNEDKLLLLPGSDVSVDVGKHDLGLMPVLM
ncbi:MAG: hypothetical protein QGI21_06610 [Candidatus Poseidoniaceae archaeon]|jgi:hypothetical protein|nr:hypothetical protein [Candidatus Poseidoniaceae archaeon]